MQNDLFFQRCFPLLDPKAFPLAGKARRLRRRKSLCPKDLRFPSIIAAITTKGVKPPGNQRACASYFSHQNAGN